MKRAVLLFLLAAAVTGCASGGGDGGGRDALYRREIGNASSRDSWDLSHRIINRHHYTVINQDTAYPEIRLETEWRQRNPLGDERALGATAAESRLLIYGRGRGQSQMGTQYTIHLTLENRIRLGGQDWNEGTNTPMFTAYADSIVADFRRELQAIGVRRF